MKPEEETYLRLAERGFLATTGENCRVTLVPVCFVYEDGTIHTAIDKKPKSRKLARVSNVLARGRFAFIVDNYSSDWRCLSYLLVHGEARVLKEGDEARQARERLLMKYPQYRVLKLGRARVLALEVNETKFWTFARKANGVRRHRTGLGSPRRGSGGRH